MTPHGKARYFRTLWLATGIFLRFLWLRRTRRLRGKGYEKAANALYVREARRFVAFAEDMGGLIIKVGQFLSVRIDLLPKECIDVLAKLQDAVPAVPTSSIIRIIEKDLGQPLRELFSEFDEAPIASASLGQVYRAALPDGTPVAVKVLRPGINALVETDLRSIRSLLRLLDRLTSLGSHVNIHDLETDFTTTFSDELDYEKEANHTEEFQRDLLFNPHVDIPKIYWDHSTRRVLTMEYMDGVRIDDLDAIDAWGIDRRELAANLGGLFFSMVLENGRYHADPHPGNVFVRRDGVIQLIDFGMVGAITPNVKEEYGDLITALVRRDAPGIVRALRALGFLGPGADTGRLAELIGPYIDTIIGDMSGFYTGPSFLSASMTGKVQLSIDHAVLDDLQRFIYTQPITMPGQSTFLGKSLVTVVGLCLRLDPEMDLLATAAPFVVGDGPADIASRFIEKAASEGKDLVTGIIPTARRLLSVAKRLDDGSFEAEFGHYVSQRIEDAERRQTRRLVRAVGVGAGVIALALRLRRRK